MEADFFIRQGDSDSPLSDVLRDEAEEAVNIQGATVSLVLTPVHGGNPIVSAEASNDQVGNGSDGTRGAVSYAWGEGETDAPGFYLGSWVVEFQGGAVQTYPNAGYVLVYISPLAPTSAGQNYLTLEELKATLTLEGTTFADGDLPLAIEAASRGIDKATERRFYLDADDAQVRYYSPDLPFTLPIDDVVDLAELAADLDGDGVFEQVWTPDVDFVLEPLNAAADGRPYETVRLHPRGLRRFPCYPRSIRATAKFGWPAVPAEVKTATTIIATRLCRRAREAPFGIVTFDRDGAAIRLARTDPDVVFLLAGVSKSEDMVIGA